MNEPGDVLAVVLTFNAPDGAAACVSAIQSQTRPPDAVLVVDNDSEVPADEAMLTALGPVPVVVLRLAENLGPAGGYAAGLARFRQLGHRYAWAMDDDVQPDADSLELLVDEMQHHNDRVVVGPLVQNLSTGERWEGWGWSGVLLPRATIEEAGVPDERLFWGLEDQEYLRDRLPLAGFPLVSCGSAVVRVTVRETRWAPWKRYYMTRNRTYRYLYGRAHIRLPVRLKNAAHAVVSDARLTWRAGVDRPAKYAYQVRGLFDGVFARLGKRVSPGGGDRPWTSTPLG